MKNKLKYSALSLLAAAAMFVALPALSPANHRHAR